MLLDFFYHLRHRGLKPSTREFLTLLEALKADVIAPSFDDFYFLSKATLVKDESMCGRYDLAFTEYFLGVIPSRKATRDYLLRSNPDEET